MRRWPILLLLFACKEERAILTVEPATADQRIEEVTPAPKVETATAARVEEGPPAVEESPSPARMKARAARDGMIARRKELAKREGRLESRIARLEAALKVTGPRNDQREVLGELGRTRGELAEVRTIRSRCERAFEAGEWGEIEEAWVIAEDLIEQREKEAAEENYRRLMELVRELRPHCEALEPIKGAR